jgi:hypothetical protein
MPLSLILQDGQPDQPATGAATLAVGIAVAWLEWPVVHDGPSSSAIHCHLVLDPSASRSQPCMNHGNLGVKVNRSVKAVKAINALKVMTFGSRGTEAFSALR